jgi:hypothetical protein
MEHPADSITVGMIAETIYLLVSAMAGEIIQSEGSADSRGGAFDRSRTKTSANVVSHAYITNAKCLFRNKCSIFTNCNPPNYGQTHFSDMLQVSKIDRLTSMNTIEKKGTCQTNSQIS